MSVFTFIIRLKGAGQNTFDDLLYLEESNFKGTKNPLTLMRTFSYEAERYRNPKVTALRKIAYIHYLSTSFPIPFVLLPLIILVYLPFSLASCSLFSHAHEQ